MKSRKSAKLKNICILIQLIITIVLVATAIIRSTNTITEVIDLTKFKSDHTEYNGEELIVVNAAKISSENPIDLAGYRLGSVNRGSYTINIDYSADVIQHCNLSINNEYDKIFLHAKTFDLSPNKQHVSYRFTVDHKVDDFTINLVNYTGGNFTIKNMNISTNGDNARTLLSIWLMLILMIDLLVFNARLKEYRRTVALIIAIAFASSIPLFMKGMNMGGHDIDFHLARIEGIADGLRQGAFPVRMNDFFYDGYGYPVDVFYGNALLYIPAMLRLIGFTVTASYKAYVFCVNCLTAAATYYCGRNIFRNKSTAAIMTLAYVLASYRLLNIYVRSAVGEYTAMIFLPLVFLAMWKIYTSDEYSLKNAIILAIGMLGLVYSHVLTTEHVAIIAVVVAVSLITKTLRKNTLRTELTAVLIFIIIGAAFIIPFVDYYINTDTLIKNTASMPKMIQADGIDIIDYFAFFKNILGSSNEVASARMQLTPGMTLIVGLFAAIYLVISRKSNKRINYLTVMAIIILFMATNMFPWNIFARTYPGMIMAQIQFPWRYIGFVSIILAVLLGLVIEYCDEADICSGKLLIAAVIGMCLVTTGSFVSKYEEGAGQDIIYDYANLKAYPGGSEYVLYNTSLNHLDFALKTKNADASVIRESGVDMVLEVKADGNSAIEIPRFAYPYYKASDEAGNEYKIIGGEINKLRIIISEPYSGKLYVQFVEPWFWRVSEVISLLGVIALILLSLKNVKNCLNKCPVIPE